MHLNISKTLFIYASKLKPLFYEAPLYDFTLAYTVH